MRMSRATEAKQRVARWTAGLAAHVEPRELGAKLIRGARTKTAVVLACLAVLALGWLMAPQAVHREPTEKVAPILEAEVARREPLRAFQGVQEVARRVRPSVVVFPGEQPAPPEMLPFVDYHGPAVALPRREGVGVLVSTDGEVLTHVSALRSGAELFVANLGSGGVTNARVAAQESGTGLALVQLESIESPATAVLAVTGIEAGDLGVAVCRRSGRNSVALAFFSSSTEPDGEIGALSDAPPSGTPLFSLAGELLAVVGGHRAGTLPAHGARAALERLRQRVADGRPFPATLGLKLQPRAEPLRSRLGEGALVSDVAEGGAAQAAGIAPGDVIVGVGGVRVRAAAPAATHIETLAGGIETTLQVLRGEEELEIIVRPTAVSGPVQGRAEAFPPDAGLAAASLFSAEDLALASVDGDARVLEVEGRPVRTRTATRRWLRRAPRPWLVRIQWRGARLYALIGEAS